MENNANSMGRTEGVIYLILRNKSKSKYGWLQLKWLNQVSRCNFEDEIVLRGKEYNSPIFKTLLILA